MVSRRAPRYQGTCTRVLSFNHLARLRWHLREGLEPGIGKLHAAQTEAGELGASPCLSLGTALSVRRGAKHSVPPAPRSKKKHPHKPNQKDKQKLQRGFGRSWKGLLRLYLFVSFARRECSDVPSRGRNTLPSTTGIHYHTDTEHLPVRCGFSITMEPCIWKRPDLFTFYLPLDPLRRRHA